MNELTIKAHPVMLFSLMRSYWIILTAPVIRVIIQYITQTGVKYVLPSEVLLFAIVILLSVIQWRRIKICVKEREIVITRGIFVKSHIIMNKSKLLGVSTKRNLFDIIFGSVSVFFDTDTQRKRTEKHGVKVNLQDSNRLFATFYDDNLMTQIKTYNRTKRFITIPLVITTAIIVLSIIKGIVFMNFGFYDLIASIIFLVFNLVYMVIGCFGCKNQMLYVGDNIFATGYKGLTLQSLLCYKKKVGMIKIIQYPADRWRGTCQAKFKMLGESNKYIKIRQIDKDAISNCFADEFNGRYGV